MNNATVGVVAALFAATASAHAQQTVSPATERLTFVGSAEYFTGQAMVEVFFGASEHRNVSGAMVTFQPGARSAWHTHPTGQTLVVVSGVGWTRTDGGEKQVIAAGDVVWRPPDVRHWHGATDTTAMRHIAVTGVQGESGVHWMEHVTDEQYLGD